MSTLFIAVGLFLAAGTYSVRKQRLPTGVVLILGIASTLCLVAGVMRLEVWQ